MPNKHESILDTVGRTPCVRLNHLAPEGVNLYVKLEAFNPMGSVKDRLALAVIERAEAEGVLSPGQTVVEATSGNTGIGLAMVCAQKGYPLVIVMAENFSLERRRLLRFLGAKVVLTPASERGSGMLAKAEELAAKHGWFLTRQFENDANVDMHSRTTAREILEDFGPNGLDFFVSGYGTGGTLKGVARVLKTESPDTRIVACEPDNSALLSSGIPQPKKPNGERDGSHPGARPHVMQGWAPDFIPRFAEDVAANRWLDRIVPVNGADSLTVARELARREGVFCGVSGGATLAGALEVCRTAPKGSTVLCMLPDTGERYLSTPLFDGVETEMNADEIAVSRSTPGYRFDTQSPAPQSAPPAPEVAADADEFVARATADVDRPVVMFALEWCEFCWSLRKLFTRAGIPYVSVDLDSVEYQEDDRGGKIREALLARTGSRTIPQVFVDGRYIGGCTETLEAYADGTLGRLLEKAGVAYNRDEVTDPYEFLPKWLHPRGAA